jgi:hypothetical protein
MSEKAPSEAEKPGDESDKPSPKDRIDAGAERFRNQATWLVTTFGALGGALVGSVSLASLLGHPVAETKQSVIGFMVVISGCVLVVLSALLTLTNSTTQPEDLLRNPSWRDRLLRRLSLGDFASKQRNLIGSFGTVAGLVEAHERAAVNVDKAYMEHKPSDADARVASLAGRRLRDLMHVVSYERIRRRFVMTVVGTCVGVLVAAAGAVTFATGIPDDEEKDETGSAPDAAPARPVYANMAIVPRARDEYIDLLGPDCDLSSVTVIVLAVEEKSYLVIASMPDDSCALSRMDVPKKEANLQACTLALPGPSASPGSTALHAQNEGSIPCDIPDNEILIDVIAWTGSSLDNNWRRSSPDNISS